MKAVNIAKGVRLAWSVIRFSKDLPQIDNPKARGDWETERAAIAGLTAEWVDYVIDAYDIHFDIEGRENIPEGPCVVIANHQGAFDIMAVIKAMEGHQVGFIAKQDFARVPFLGRWIKAIRGVFIRRGDARESLKTIQEGIQFLKDGFSLAIFPEGTRSKDGRILAFKAGSFKLATKAKVPVLPMAIEGTSRIFEDSGVLTKGQSASVRILPPISTACMGRGDQTTLHERVRTEIAQALDGIRAAKAGAVEVSEPLSAESEISEPASAAVKVSEPLSAESEISANETLHPEVHAGVH